MIIIIDLQAECGCFLSLWMFYASVEVSFRCFQWEAGHMLVHVYVKL